MKFSEKLKKAMQDLGINQKQLAGMTGIGKSSISQYLSGKNIPTAERQKDIAVSLGLEPGYFLQDETIKAVPATKVAAEGTKIKKLLVANAAKLMGMSHDTVRKGLQQRRFDWGYAIKTSENHWTYFINAIRFAEIERVDVPPEMII